MCRLPGACPPALPLLGQGGPPDCVYTAAARAPWLRAMAPQPGKTRPSLRSLGRCAPAVVAALSALQRRLLHADHALWQARFGRALALLLVFVLLRHTAWHRASAPLKLAANAPVRSEWAIGPSNIQGQGVHVTADMRRGESLGPCVTWSGAQLLARPQIFGLGPWINHSWLGSATLAYRETTGTTQQGRQQNHGELELVLLRDLHAGEEVTSNYLISPSFIALPMPWW